MTGESKLQLVLDANGYPALSAEPQPAQRTEPAPAPSWQDVLTFRQCAQLLGLPADDALAEILTRESLPRVIGWPRRSIEEMRERMERGEVEGVEVKR